MPAVTGMWIPPGQCTIQKAVQDIVVKHHLGGKKVRSSILLAAQIVQIGIPVGRFRVSLRIARRTHAKRAAAADGGNQLGCIAKVFLAGKAHAFGQVATKGQNTSDARLRKAVQHCVNLIPRVAHTGQAGERRNPMLLHIGADLAGKLGRAAGRAAGNADRGGRQRADIPHRGLGLLDLVKHLGRKRLAAQMYAGLVKQLPNGQSQRLPSRNQ